MPKDSILKVIADNKILFDEVKKIVEAEFETQPVELTLSNERLGERERARLEGKLAVERAFSKILSYQSSVDKPEVKNPAR